jgi:hypothetical protein
MTGSRYQRSDPGVSAEVVRGWPRVSFGGHRVNNWKPSGVFLPFFAGPRGPDHMTPLPWNVRCLGGREKGFSSQEVFPGNGPVVDPAAAGNVPVLESSRLRAVKNPRQ